MQRYLHVLLRLSRYHCVAWCPFKFKITHFLLVGTTKVVIFLFFMFRFLGGSFRCNIAATNFFFCCMVCRLGAFMCHSQSGGL